MHMVVRGGADARTAKCLIICVICQAPMPPGFVTAGAVTADGAQAFACTRHLRERRRWIATWAAFEYQQYLVRKAGKGVQQ